MTQETFLRVVVEKHDIRKLPLPDGIPKTVEGLIAIIKNTFTLKGDFSLLYEDKDFRNELFTLTSTSNIEGMDTVKLVLKEPVVTLSFSPIDSDFCSTLLGMEQDTPTNSTENATNGTHSISSQDTVTNSTENATNDTHSISSQDTVILPSSYRTDPWPVHFEIPTLSPDVQLILNEANRRYSADGTLFHDPSVKSAIRQTLADAIFQYTAYPKSLHILQVVEALVEKYPCLKEPGSVSGMYGWQQSLKTRMSNFRRKLKSRNMSWPEIEVNFLKKKRANEKAPAKNVKKPKRAEVNFLPPFPAGETKESLEKDRMDLIYEVKKKHNEKVVTEKMGKTFALRRLDVVDDSLSVQDLKERWPALFWKDQVKDEFQRLTAVPLEQKFLAKLDAYTPRLIEVMKAKGGVAGIKMRPMLEALSQLQCVSQRRDLIISCLIEYLGESNEDLFFKCQEEDRYLNPQTLKILLVHSPVDQVDPVDIAISVDGTEVLTDIENKWKACVLLMGVIYALDLKYPAKLKNTFEVFQKLFLELDPKRLLAKVQTLSLKLLL